MIMQEDFIFPPPPDPRSPFRLHLAGTSYCDGNYRIELRERDLYFVFEYVESGRGQLQIDGVEYFPKAGDLYWIPDSGRRSYWSSSEEPWIKHWFNVSGPLVPELLKLYSLENVRLIHNFSRPELFTDGLARLQKAPQQAHLPLGPDILHAILAQAAADLLTDKDKQHSFSEEGVLLRDYLDRQIFRPMPDLETMSRVLRRSPVQTIRIFRRDFGETPYQYLLKRKLAAAQELLLCTRQSVKQISAGLYFSNEYYFAGLFKKKTGLSPGRYRREAGEGTLVDFNIIESEPGHYVNRALLASESD